MPIPTIIALPVGVLILALLIALGLQTYRINSFATETAQAQTLAAQSRSQLDGLRATLAETIAENERKRLVNQLANDMELKSLRTQAATLKATLDQRQLDYNKASAQLRSVVTNAPKADSRALGPTVLRLLDGLRTRQQAWHSNDSAATPGTK